MPSGRAKRQPDPTSFGFFFDSGLGRYDAIAPVLDGEHGIFLAPTAGGKTSHESHEKISPVESMVRAISNRFDRADGRDLWRVGERLGFVS